MSHHSTLGLLTYHLEITIREVIEREKDFSIVLKLKNCSKQPQNTEYQKQPTPKNITRRDNTSQTVLYPGPYFDDIVPTNLTVQQGDTAYLQCKIYGVAN